MEEDRELNVHNHPPLSLLPSPPAAAPNFPAKRGGGRGEGSPVIAGF